MNNKSKFQEIANKYIKREGIGNLLAWLDQTDFYDAPASTRFHNSFEGGLCLHSLNVWTNLCKLLHPFNEIQTNVETAAIITLFHDLCKVNLYKVEMRNVKENNVWVQKPYYTVDEEFPFGGHGAKSVYLIQKHMKLTDEEAVAIMNHMGNEDGKYTVFSSYEKYPIAWLLHVADEAATILDEKRGEK